MFEAGERDSRTPFGEELSIHLLQLGAPQRQALSTSEASGYDAVVERWARFFTRYDDPVELERLAAEDPMMALAKQTLEALSRDPEARRRAQRREDDLRLYEIELRANLERATQTGWNQGWDEGRTKGWDEGRTKGWDEGRTKGCNEGKAALLLRLLTKRFGPLPQAVLTRVDAATSEQLDAWAERVLTEPTVDDVLT
ncbi:DUF4351 domain-containing protein [Paraliomyxa miuraensis]|uniref:DUF4351 domain-containing protein n=1 Tax=Paraliomyxa miuraensis TaxID=376150 RepID=UPI002252D1BB|nr:DUF4351 domain-containing protein [Paraliomyxa miuraensis]MCX4245254.1 DUF4351 domain-containing protein [Paraliomyxa miuraensis]